MDNRVLRTRSLNHLTLKVPVVILMKLFFPGTLEATLLDTVAAEAANRRTSNNSTTGNHQEDTHLASTKDSNLTNPRTQEIGMPHRPRRLLTPTKPIMASRRPGELMSMLAHIAGLQMLPVIAAAMPRQAQRTLQDHTQTQDRTPGIPTKAKLKLMSNLGTLYTAVAISMRRLARQTMFLPPNRDTSMNPSTRLQTKPRPQHKTPVRPPPPPSVHRLKQDIVEHSRAIIAIAIIAKAAPDTVGDINLTTLTSNDVRSTGGGPCE